MPKRATKRKLAVRRVRSPSRRSRSPHKPTKDAVTLIVQLRPREGQELLLEAELRALVGPTRKEEGCLSYELYRSSEAPTRFMLHEVWASREDHAHHTNTPHFLRWNARKEALLASRESAFWQRLV